MCHNIIGVPHCMSQVELTKPKQLKLYEEHWFGHQGEVESNVFRLPIQAFLARKF
jgi:hypothetical protein